MERRTQNGLYVRPATRSDVGAVAALEQQCFPDPWPRGAFAQFVDARGFLIAVDPSEEVSLADVPPDGTLAGYVVTTPASGRRETLVHVRNLAVAPAYRRQGIATRMLSKSIDRYRDAGFTGVKLEVRASNEAAIGLYRDEGFTITDRLPGYYEDGETALVMARSLSDKRNDG